MAGAALPVDRLAVSIAEASRLTSLSRGTIRAYAKAGETAGHEGWTTNDYSYFNSS
jgi:hypothetical protein